MVLYKHVPRKIKIGEYNVLSKTLDTRDSKEIGRYIFKSILFSLLIGITLTVPKHLGKVYLMKDWANLSKQEQKNGNNFC